MSRPIYVQIHFGVPRLFLKYSRHKLDILDMLQCNKNANQPSTKRVAT